MQSNDMNEGLEDQRPVRRIQLRLGAIAKFGYTNYKGVWSDLREVIVVHVYYGLAPYHSGEQWFMYGHDLHKNACRTFALKDMKPLSDAVAAMGELRG